MWGWGTVVTTQLLTRQPAVTNKAQRHDPQVRDRRERLCWSFAKGQDWELNLHLVGRMGQQEGGRARQPRKWACAKVQRGANPVSGGKDVPRHGRTRTRGLLFEGPGMLGSSKSTVFPETGGGHHRFLRR